MGWTRTKIPQAVHDLIKGTAEFDAFFAPEHHGAKGATQGIFEMIRECSGFIVFLHPRGKVIEDRKTFYRSSVWVNQELASHLPAANRAPESRRDGPATRLSGPLV